MDKQFFQMQEEGVYELLGSSPQGLTSAEAAARLERERRNVLEKKGGFPCGGS